MTACCIAQQDENQLSILLSFNGIETYALVVDNVNNDGELVALLGKEHNAANFNLTLEGTFLHS